MNLFFSKCALLFCLVAIIAEASKPDFSLWGFGSVAGDKGQVLAGGTTGGAGGQTVVATTAEEFLKYIASPEPLIIQVKGTIQLPAGSDKASGMFNVTSNKSLIGIGSDATLSGGGLCIGFSFVDNMTSPPDSTVSNIIIRNLNFTGSPDDAINIQMFTHHVWIDHNNLTGARDGLLDIKRGSSYITVSWNYMHDHNKTMLLGHDNRFAHQDTGRLRVTYHHNYFNNTKTRVPRVRFAEPVHVVNNYTANGNYAIASTCGAGVYMEGNYLYNIDNPLRFDFDGEPLGKTYEINNICDSCGNPFKVAGTVESPSKYYTYTADDPKVIPDMVKNWAGTGKIDIAETVPSFRQVQKLTRVSGGVSETFTITGQKVIRNNGNLVPNAQNVYLVRNGSKVTKTIGIIQKSGGVF